MFEYQIMNGEEKTVVLFNGDMDIEITEIMLEEILPILQNYSNVDLNFANVAFVDSTGIGLLINLVQELKECQVNVTISQLNEHVSQVFDLLQIPEILGQEVFLD